jgi:hypothetical protein
MNSLLLFISIIIFNLTSLQEQKMDTTNVIGKWTSFDTANKRILTFNFDTDSTALISSDQGSMSLKYKLDHENDKKVLTLQTADNRTIKHIVRFRSDSELELYVSKIVDFNMNSSIWGINQFIILTRLK